MQVLVRTIADQTLQIDRELAASTQRGLSVPGYQATPGAPVARSVAAFGGMLAAALSA